MLKLLCAIIGIPGLPCWAALAKVLWDVATARFVLEPWLAHSCTAMVPSTNTGFGVRSFPSDKKEQQEQEVDSASCTELSVCVVFLIPPVKIIFLQMYG